MSSVWLIRELFGWGHWTWRWGNSQRCEKVDYQDWSPYQPRRAPSMVINRRYTNVAATRDSSRRVNDHEVKFKEMTNVMIMGHGRGKEMNMSIARRFLGGATHETAADKHVKL
ncbi:hypothetical protein GGX14DRAFT_391541 [Mycena pura]|uniref:Uncharacterized protein n=1 Tax=Mycena pura TaxID=153505 RepID=A0AAD6VPC3_9AGAR|nr:hypothetical protein GGX14DRAFT_391541 [Mycena pura]